MVSSDAVRPPFGRRKRKTSKTVKLDQSPVSVTSPRSGLTALRPDEGDIDMVTAVLNGVAKELFGRHFKLPKHCATLAVVEGSRAEVLGWANWTPGDDSVFGDPGRFPQNRSKRGVES